MCGHGFFFSDISCRAVNCQGFGGEWIVGTHGCLDWQAWALPDRLFCVTKFSGEAKCFWQFCCHCREPTSCSMQMLLKTIYGLAKRKHSCVFVLPRSCWWAHSEPLANWQHFQRWAFSANLQVWSAVEKATSHQNRENVRNSAPVLFLNHSYSVFANTPFTQEKLPLGTPV